MSPITTNEVMSAYFMWSRSNAAAPFNAWLDQVKADAWDEGHGQGWQNAREALLTDMFSGPTLNPYRSKQ